MLLTVVLLAGMLASPAGAVGDISDTINVRLPGGANDPARIALRFARATFPDGGVDRVVLATEDTFADALASGTLQGADVPLLLTSGDDVRTDVRSELERLGASGVLLLGGTAALDDSVEQELSDADLDVFRVAGRTRIETAVEVADLAPESSTAIVSRAFGDEVDPSRAFADSLSAASLAADNGWPSLLTATDALSPETRAAIIDSPVERVLLMGGTAAIGTAVEEELLALGIDVERVAGPTRFSTALEVASLRGFEDAGDAQRVILVEGQAPDAWAAGFAAASHAVVADAPILLANGPTIPPETAAFLDQMGAAFAVDVEDVDEPVLVCAADPAACDEARRLLGLPAEAVLAVDEPEGGVPSRSALPGHIDLFGADADVAVFGSCVTDGLVVVQPDGTFTVDVQGSPGVCSLTFEVAFANGSVQQVAVPIVVAPAEPLVGPVIDTETGGDAYTFVPAGATTPLTVTYDPDDVFMVDGEDATIGAFEAALTVADQVTFRADTVDGIVHEVVNVSPSQVRLGTVGDVDTGQQTFAIIEPVSGTPLRSGISFSSEQVFRVDGEPTGQDEWFADASEGDLIDMTSDAALLTNAAATGAVDQVTIDPTEGIVRFTVGALGDDPRNAVGDRFRFTADNPDQTIRIDDRRATFADLAEQISPGDQATYTREDDHETLRLVNRARPPVGGLVTESFDPDGSPIAPEPEDGGELTILGPRGRTTVTYSAQAVFRIDGRRATEVEFEAARTPGDAVSHQAADTATRTEEEVSLTNRDLSGDLVDITEGADTYDVVTLAGVVYDDLDYTAGVLGGEDVYVVDGDDIDLDEFEDLLGLIDDGEQQATIVVRAVGGDTEHRLTFISD